MSSKLVGQSTLRKEGIAKVKGQAKYIDDITFPDMLYGVTVRSSYPRGKIKNISFGKGINWDQFVVVTAKDIPGANHIACILKDQPCLADQVVNHPGEAILLLAHPDKYLLEEARRAVKIEIEESPAVFTIEDSLAKKEIIWGDDNIFKSYKMNKGNVDSVWKEAAHIVEGEYFTGAQEQLYIEPQGVIAKASPSEGVTVWGSMQCPYYVHKAMVELFGLEGEKVRIIQTETGGGFGGKEDYPSMLSGHAALLSLKAGKPVKMVYDRAEDMVVTTKRHPSRMRIKTAVDKEGKLLAHDIEFVIDGGAYATITAVVLSRGTIHAVGPYYCPNVCIHSKAVATNTPPHGAFRGFGAPQSFFGIERHMDRLAQKVGLSAQEFRRKNFVADGKTLATGQVVQDGVDLEKLMERAFKESHYYEKKKRFEKENKTNPIKKGIGFAAFMHGAGFTGSGEVYLGSKVAVEATKDGKIRVLTSSTEMGQGKNTVFAQIATDALGTTYENIEVTNPDTSEVPDSGPTVASRTSMVVGDLVGKACVGLKGKLREKKLLNEKYTPEDFQKACATYVQEYGPLKIFSKYQPPPNIKWDDEKYEGDAYGTYAWAVYVAEVSVDTVTYETTVDDFVAVQEVGRVLNPILAAGQIEGGVAQGIGYALYEKVVWDKGKMINNQMTNYIMPTAVDLPPIRVFFEEVPYVHGFSGAKGIGELPMDGPAPALLNAVEDAIGVSVNEIPMLPEDLMEAMNHGK